MKSYLHQVVAIQHPHDTTLPNADDSAKRGADYREKINTLIFLQQ